LEARSQSCGLRFPLWHCCQPHSRGTGAAVGVPARSNTVTQTPKMSQHQMARFHVLGSATACRLPGPSVPATTTVSHCPNHPRQSPTLRLSSCQFALAPRQPQQLAPEGPRFLSRSSAFSPVLAAAAAAPPCTSHLTRAAALFSRLNAQGALALPPVPSNLTPHTRAGQLLQQRQQTACIRPATASATLWSIGPMVDRVNIWPALLPTSLPFAEMERARESAQPRLPWLAANDNARAPGSRKNGKEAQLTAPSQTGGTTMAMTPNSSRRPHRAPSTCTDVVQGKPPPSCRHLDRPPSNCVVGRARLAAHGARAPAVADRAVDKPTPAAASGRCVGRRFRPPRAAPHGVGLQWLPWLPSLALPCNLVLRRTGSACSGCLHTQPASPSLLHLVPRSTGLACLASLPCFTSCRAARGRLDCLACPASLALPCNLVPRSTGSACSGCLGCLASPRRGGEGTPNSHLHICLLKGREHTQV
jgi:hypothetical protein